MTQQTQTPPPGQHQATADSGPVQKKAYFEQMEAHLSEWPQKISELERSGAAQSQEGQAKLTELKSQYDQAKQSFDQLKNAGGNAVHAWTDMQNQLHAATGSMEHIGSFFGG